MPDPAGRFLLEGSGRVWSKPQETPLPQHRIAPPAIRGRETDAEHANFHTQRPGRHRDRKSTRLNSSHVEISYAVFCLKKKKTINEQTSNSSPVPYDQDVLNIGGSSHEVFTAISSFVKGYSAPLVSVVHAVQL